MMPTTLEWILYFTSEMISFKGIEMMIDYSIIENQTSIFISSLIPDRNLTIENIGVSPIDDHLTFGIQI